MTTDNDLLKQGIVAFNAGRKAEARKLLMQVVKQDKRNETAWLWLSDAVDTDKERRICLENVLVINPGNEIARRGLASLVTKEGMRLLSATPPPTPRSQTRRSNNRTKLIVALSSTMVLIVMMLVGFFAWNKVFSPIKEVIDPNSPENVAKRFLQGTFDTDDVAPDGTYESTFGFDMIWFNQMGPGQEYELEIQDVIVRDSMRPNSKEVTIWYTQRYNELDPPNNNWDNWDAPLEEWVLTGERIESDGTVFFVLELLDDRWVVWCAETGGSSPRFPDLCEY